jgi:hypothetical protein
MSVPPKLQGYIEDALDKLWSNPLSDLNLDSRLAIYDFFDTLPEPNGRMARTDLSLMATQKALPMVLQPAWGYPGMPELICATATRLLEYMREGWTGEQIDELARKTTIEELLGSETARTIIRRGDVPLFRRTPAGLSALSQELNSVTGTQPSSWFYHAWCAQLAAMATLEEALAGHWWAGQDASQWAALAYAGGTWSGFDEPEAKEDPLGPHGSWDYSSPDVEANRRDFWEWWCKEAVPASWESLGLADA